MTEKAVLRARWRNAVKRPELWAPSGEVQGDLLSGAFGPAEPQGEPKRTCEGCGKPLVGAEDWKRWHRHCYAQVRDADSELARLRRKWPVYVAQLMGDA